MKKIHLYILAGIMLATLSFSFIQLTMAGTTGVSHSTDEITSGSFQVGNYKFPGKLGIGVEPQDYNLDVASNGNNTARFGTDESDNISVGGGAGKITAGTVDPLFNIQGDKYATFLAGMPGVKEEVAGVIELINEQYVIDFNESKKGSDLWLFYQITDFGKDWKNLVVLLTAEGPGQIWYKKDSANNKLTIHSETASSASYRLTAPRFDWKKWPNKSESKELKGLIINEIINNQY